VQNGVSLFSASRLPSASTVLTGSSGTIKNKDTSLSKLALNSELGWFFCLFCHGMLTDCRMCCQLNLDFSLQVYHTKHPPLFATHLVMMQHILQFAAIADTCQCMLSVAVTRSSWWQYSMLRISSFVDDVIY